MKNLISIIFILALGTSLFGQEISKKDKKNVNKNEIQTLFGKNKFSNGGYGGFGAGYTVIDNKDAIVTSGRAAWVIGHGLALGVAGTGFINDFHYDPLINDDVNLTGGYGGFFIEPILFGRLPVHLTLPVVAGIGGIAYTRSHFTTDPWEYQDVWVEDTETFLILEPGIELELNILRFFRIAGGISYRMTSEIKLIDTAPDVLNGLSAGISFKFGKF